MARSSVTLRRSIATGGISASLLRRLVDEAFEPLALLFGHLPGRYVKQRREHGLHRPAKKRTQHVLQLGSLRLRARDTRPIHVARRVVLDAEMTFPHEHTKGRPHTGVG